MWLQFVNGHLLEEMQSVCPSVRFVQEYRGASMKKLWLALLGTVVLSTTLSFTPAFALGGCGQNYHRDGNGKCVFGGQNEDYCLKTKGHPATRMPNGSMVCK